MELLSAFLNLIIEWFVIVFAVLQDLPTHLAAWSSWLGPWIYLVLFLTIFAETGLVVTPFLPGDSLLFAIGALAALEGSNLSLPALALVMIVAAILGDTVNYAIGRWAGPRLFSKSQSKWLNPQHLLRAQAFYQKHGGKTIVLARFLPIIRTYAPFVAGMGRMNYRYFVFYNISGAIVWILLFLVAGFYFGNIPSVKTNFHYVIAAIIVISALPAMVEFYRARMAREPESSSSL